MSGEITSVTDEERGTTAELAVAVIIPAILVAAIAYGIWYFLQPPGWQMTFGMEPYHSAYSAATHVSSDEAYAILRADQRGLGWAHDTYIDVWIDMSDGTEYSGGWPRAALGNPDGTVRHSAAWGAYKAARQGASQGRAGE